MLTECWSVVFYARNSLRGSLPYEQSLTGSGFKDSYPGEYFTMTNTYDKGLLLHHASHHPTACKKGIIYSQALRYRRIITDDDDLRLQLLRLHKILLVRGYSHSTITTAINKATSKTQSQLLQHKPPPATTGVHIPFVTPYNTDLPPLSRILRENWHIITKDTTLSQLFPRQPFISYSRPNNILVHSRFSTHNKKIIPPHPQ